MIGPSHWPQDEQPRGTSDPASPKANQAPAPTFRSPRLSALLAHGTFVRIESSDGTKPYTTDERKFMGAFVPEKLQISERSLPAKLAIVIDDLVFQDAYKPASLRGTTCKLVLRPNANQQPSPARDLRRLRVCAPAPARTGRGSLRVRPPNGEDLASPRVIPQAPVSLEVP